MNNLKEIVCGNKARYCIKTYDGQSSLFLLAKCNSNTVSNKAYQAMGSNNFRKGGKAAKGGYHAKQTTSSTSNAKKTKKSVADYSYELGIKHQSELSRTTEFLINYISQKYENGPDLATALETRKEYDFDAEMPVQRESKKTDKEEKEKQNKQFAVLFKSASDRFLVRMEMYDQNMKRVFAFLRVRR